MKNQHFVNIPNECMEHGYDLAQNDHNQNKF